MDASPATTHSSPHVPPVNESCFECPKCHRQCKSRTWFLKHLEGCFKGTSSSHYSGAAYSPTPASGEASGVGPSPAPYQQQQHNARAPRSGGADDTVSSPVFESIGTSSPTSSVHSYQEVQSRKTSRLKLGVGGADGGNDVAFNLSDSGVSPHAGTSRSAALAFSFKHSYSSDTSQSASHAKFLSSVLDDTTSRVFGGSLNDGSRGDVGGGGGSSAPPILSQRANMSQASSSYAGSPHGVRAGSGYGEGASAGASHRRASPARAAQAAGVVWSNIVDAVKPDHSPGLGSNEDISPRHVPARQGSFRLHSDVTWTQYTPTTSSSPSSSSDDDDDDDDHDAAQNEAGASLAHSRLPSSRSLNRSGTNGTAGVNSSHHQHHHNTNRGTTHVKRSRHLYGRDTGSLSFNTGSHLVSPGGPDALSEPWLQERNGSVGSTRNESFAASQAKQSSLSFAAASSLPREPERMVPRLVMGSAAGDHTPLDRKNSGAGFGGGGGGAEGMYGTDRLSRSARGSASPGTLSRMSSSASPMFAQAMASPMVAHMNASLPSGAGASRHGGFHNATNSGSGVGLSGARTPRQSDRSGAATPRAISFQRGGAVGSGGFGTVYQAILSDGSLAAVKELKLENTNLKAIDREVRAMSGIPPHPNCVRYLGSRYSAHHYYIIMEYISGGSINSLRKSVGRFRESVFQRYAYMVLLGLAHLHAHGIVHRDIKGANVLLDESGCAKIVDFGCSRDVNQATTTLSGGGTPLWMAPEVCRGEPATEKSDVWAFGCLCLEMTNDTGLPWSFPANITLQGVVYALACAKASPPIPENLSPEAQDFLRQCLRVDPEERATVSDLLQHPFFDVDLMEDSDEDEMLSSCPQSAVKRVAQHVHQTRVQNARVVASGAEDSASSRDEARISPLLPGLLGGGGGGGARLPRGSLSNANLDSNGDLAVVSQSTHSKSPSGPRLDHYPRSVNMGFSLQAVDDDEEEEAERGNSDGSHQLLPQRQTNEQEDEPSAFGINSDQSNQDVGGPPAIPSTSVPTNRLRTPSMRSQALHDGGDRDEDEDEYTQMITEIITQAREAYTDEERRMTERRRQRNVLYPSSDDDDDDGSFSDSSGDTSAGGAMINRGRALARSPSGASSDMRNSSDGDSDDSVEGSGGPERHRLGATWRASCNASSPVISVNHPRQPAEDAHDAFSDPRHQPTRSTSGSSPTAVAELTAPQEPRGGAAAATATRRSSATPSSLPAVSGRASLPAAVHADPLNLSLSSPSPTPSSLMAGGSKSHPQPPPVSEPLYSASPLSAASHRIPSSHRQTPTSPPPPSSVFRDAAPQETAGDIRAATTAAAPPKGVVAATSGISLSLSNPGGPGRTSSTLHPQLRLSPSFLPLSKTDATSPQPKHNHSNNTTTTSTDGSRSPRTPQPAPALTVGGPSGQSPQGGGGRVSTEAQLSGPIASVHQSPNSSSSPVEWYSSSSGRQERNYTWQTAASAQQPKEWSMAQREMQDMLDWGRASEQHASTVSSSAPGTAKRSSKESSSDNGGAVQDRHRHRRPLQYTEEEPTQQSLTTADSKKNLSAVEKVEGKRRHIGLGIFRSRKSK